jgi:type II secretory pathway pseudopilin PulG
MKSSTRTLKSRHEKGYILLTLLLIMALLAIGAATAASTIAFQIRRDREEEMIHRAMQYRRAIRQFTKHTGRYPRTTDELVTSNGLRYLRKAYKDPITGKDFRLLHMWDIPSITNSAGVLPAPGANGLPTGQDPNSASSPDQAQTGADTATAQNPSTSSPSPVAGSRTSSSSSPQPGDNLGGGLIVGIASTSPKKTIREFERKSRYNQWLFFYDPASDQGRDPWGPTPLARIPTLAGIPGNPTGQLTGPAPTPQSPPATQ